MKGIILAGGLGSRLYPITLSTCKQLLPIFDKPMIFYPLSILMQAGIREIMIITTPKDVSRFSSLLRDGSHLGLSISYGEQNEPKGIAEAFIIAEDFIKEDLVCLILGDNLFYGNALNNIYTKAKEHKEGGLIFGYEVQDPKRYGVLAFDDHRKIQDIIEKPKNPPSSFAVTGLYFYDNNVIEIAKNLEPSFRGELEITDVNRAYLKNGRLKVQILERGFAWLDTGTPQAFSKASNFIQTMQERQGIKIGCIEEVAYQMGFIDLKQMERLAAFYGESDYGSYLKHIISREMDPLLQSLMRCHT